MRVDLPQVSTRVNSVRNDGADLLEPTESADRGQLAHDARLLVLREAEGRG